MIKTHLKFVAAMGSMKGSLSAKNSSIAVSNGIKNAFQQFYQNFGKTASKITYEIIERPAADGGDDTLDAIADKIYETKVMNPLGHEILAIWGARDNQAVIEMAKASGIALIKSDQLNPFITTTFGTGQLIFNAIKKGYKNILLTIGGSATIDGGIGALGALGAQFFDKNSQRIKPYGNSAAGIVQTADFSKMKTLFKGISIKIACDVTNPLFGPNGSSNIFGPQKLPPKIRMNEKELKKCINKMEKNLMNFNQVLIKSCNRDVSSLPGSGAAGGFPIGFCSVLNAKLDKGSKLVLDLLKFDELLDADVVFTSEGRCDNQTLSGKTPFAICQKMKNSKVMVLCGGIQNSEVEEKMLKSGATLVSSICDKPMTLEESQKRTPELIQRAASRITYFYLSQYFQKIINSTR